MSRSFPQREPDIASVLRDENRLRALRRYEVCDTEPDPAFDRVARLAAALFDAPMALVNFIDGERQWLKARVGINEERTEVPFCVHTLARGRVCVVEELGGEDPFATHPFVVDHDIRFYAGVPLIGPDEHRLGTLCVLDTEARSVSEEKLERLEDLAAVVGDELAHRRERTVSPEERTERTGNLKPQIQLEGRGRYQRLHLALEAANAGTFEHELGTGRVRWDERSLDVFGMEEKEQNAQVSRLEDLILDDDLEQVKAAFNRIVEGTASRYSLSYRIRRPNDGEVRHIRSRGIILRREDGTAERIIGLNQDITDWKEIVQDLRRSREKLSMAVEGGNIGTWNWNLETDEVFFNRRWAEMLGYTREELDFHFSTWEELVHPEDLPRAENELEAYIEGDADLYAPEIRMRTKAGEWKWIQTIGKVIERDEEEAVVRAAGIHLDIDDRKRAEEVLREAKGRYQTLIEHFPNGAVVLFNDDLQYTIAGGQELEEVELSPADFEGSTPRDLFPTEFAETTIEHYRRALDGKKDVFEQTLRGQHYRVQTLPVRDDDGRIVAGMAVSQNVTDRKESRRRLEQYRTYTDRLLDALDDVFFALDEEGTLQRWNARATEVTGYTDDEIDGKKAFAFIPESEQEWVAAKIAKGFTSGSLRIEVPLVCKDGTTMPYEFVGNLVQHPNGSLQIVGIGRDITERKRRERRLQQAETFFQNAQDTLFLLDVEHSGDRPAFAIQRVNPAYERATGLREDEVRGCSIEEVIGAEAAQHAETMCRKCVARREPVEYEEELSFDETTTYWQTRVAPIVVEGQVQQIVGTTRDVTERRRRKEVLERQNDLFTKAENLASVGAWEYDVQTGDGIFSPQAYRIHGVPPGTEMSPERSLQSYHPDDRSTIRDAFTRALEEGLSYDLELRLTRDDGEQRWVHTRGEPQTEDGEVVRVRGVIQDITDRVHRRQKLEAAKEAAEEADRMKTTLLSNMNHELRTPLTAILTFSKLIQDNPDVAGQFVDRIVNGGRRLLYTLNTVVELAKLESTDVSLDPTSLRLSDVVESAVDDFRDRLQGEPVDLGVDLAEHNSIVELDEHLTERILTHLVHNAVKFTEEGSVTIAARTEANAVEFVVADTGIGIDPDFRPHVFDEFAQGSSGDARSYEGNGIGLTVVQRLVERMDGTVDIESTLGEGTQVTVRLPVA